MNSEYAFGIGVLQIAAKMPGNVATFDDLRREIPNYVPLDDDDRKLSLTRANEEVWEQRVRNIVSHRATKGNIIHDGLATSVPGNGIKITASGLSLLRYWKLI